MEIENKLLSLILFIIIVFILLNQLIKLSIFAYKYYNYYIIASINKTSCGNYFSESDHPRFYISKNIYDLHIDNDIFNSKTYIIIIYIFSVFLYIYAFLHLFQVFSDKSFATEKYYISNKSFINSIIMLLLFILSLVYFIIIMVYRFDKGYEEGYNRFYSYNISSDLNGYNKYVSEIAFYTTISIILAFNIFILFYNNIEILEFNIIFYVLYAAAFYIFIIYLMNNLLNIILSFKNNEYPLNNTADVTKLDNYYNKEKNKNAIFYNNIDISYGSENYFYKQYLDYSINDWWFDIYKDIHDIQKMGYKKPTSYNISNLKNSSSSDSNSYNSAAIYTGNIRNFILIIIIIITCSIGLYLICLLIVYFRYNEYFNDNIDNIKKYGKNIFFNIIIPLLILFIIFFVIIATMEYNTFINKDILININKKYKQDLNNLNNSILPVLYSKDKQIKSDINSIKYSYIIYNVITSYLLNTINIFDLASIIPINKETINDNIRTVTTQYTINDTISPYKEKYNIDSTTYNLNYYSDVVSTIPANNSYTLSSNLLPKLSSNLLSNISFDRNSFDIYVKSVNNDIFIKANDNEKDNFDYQKYNTNIFDNNTIKNNNINYNIKNNILCSMYNMDDYLNIKDDDNDKKLNFFRNNIFYKKNGEDNNIYINKFLLKSNLDNKYMNFDKYKKYDYYIDNIIEDFIKNLIIFNYNIKLYNEKDAELTGMSVTEKEDIEKQKNIINISIENTFNLIINNLKNSLNKMIDNFSNLENDSNNIIFKNIIKNYKKINNENNIDMRAYDIEINNKFINHIEIDVNTYNTIFDNKSKNVLSNDNESITILEEHKDIVNNANYIINERLYILIATYIISLFIAYKLHKM